MLDSRGASGFATPAIKHLLILNGLAFLGQVVIDDLPQWGPMMQWLALWPAGTPGVTAAGEVVPPFYPWQLVTSAFLHGSFSHILFNLFGLWMLGGAVEQALGTPRFVRFYLFSVLGASALQLAVISAPFVAGIGTAGDAFPTVGASGGVLGVLAAFGMLFPRERLFIFPLPVPIQARLFVLGYAALSLGLGVTGTAAGIAHFAHLGGMITGALLILVWRRRSRALA